MIRLEFVHVNVLYYIGLEITLGVTSFCSDQTFFCQNALETELFEHEQTSLLQLITRVSQV